MRTGGAAILTVRGLACARGGTAVLEGLDFHLAPGEALILRGPNGSGKTTLLRTLAGLQPPLAGRVAGGGEGAAYAGHLDGIKAVLSVAENLGFWAALHGTGQPAVAAAMAAMDLAGLSDRPAGELSAGQKRRLGLARLLVAGRALWLLDEPTVSLDAAAVARFAGVVRAHLAAGGAAAIATHIDLGLPEAQILDLTPFRARPRADAAGFGGAEALA